jgi:hypothetical protein
MHMTMSWQVMCIPHLVQLSCCDPLTVCLPADQLVLQPIKRIEGTVKLPGSKSLSNRILLLAALAEGTTLVKNLLVSASDRSRLCVRLCWEMAQHVPVLGKWVVLTEASTASYAGSGD